MANVDYTVKALQDLLPQYEMITDCIKGSIAVKGRTVKYLPQPNAADTSRENQLAYGAYLTRAVFFNVVGRTLQGLLGTIYTFDPSIVVPDQLQPIVDDATGGGVSMVQLSKQTAGHSLSLGRSGLFVDYPDFGDGGASRKDVDDGTARPTLTVYPPEDIINWRKQSYGAKEKLALVVIRETYVLEDDGFEEKRKTQHRVLRLVNGVYYQYIYRDSRSRPFSVVAPVDGAGKTFDEIPFKFVGSEDNDSDPDLPPLFAMADLNIAHFRNSADYEQALHAQQPTPYFTGLTQEWITSVWGGTTEVEFGVRAVIALPENATAGMLEPSENGMIKEGMEAKERQMAGLGAQLVEQKSVQRTATEAKQDDNSDNSILSNCADNTSAAYTWALRICAQFLNVPTTVTTTKQVAKGEGLEATTEETTDTKELEFTLNTAFNLSTLTPEEIKQLLLLFQGGAISWTEFRTRLRYAGIATQTDEDARAEIDADTASDLTTELAKMDREAEIGADPKNQPPEPPAA